MNLITITKKMKKYYDNILGVESTLPIEIINLFDSDKMTIDDPCKENQLPIHEELALDEYELAMTG